MTEPSKTPPRPPEADPAKRPRLGRKPSTPEPATPWRVEGLPKGPGSDPPGPPNNGGMLRRPRWFVILAIFLAINWIVSGLFLRPTGRTQVSYTFFTQQVQANNVDEITSTADTIQGDFKNKVAYPPNSSDTTQVSHFSTQRPSFAGDKLLTDLSDHNVIVNAKSPDQPAPWWEQLLAGFGPTLLLVGVAVWWFRRAAAGGGIGGLGRSRAKLYQPDAGPRTTFEDVAGIDEVEHEVSEIVDFLRDPDRFRRLGAQIPRGVLLSGQPGTGKTLLARAVAGEAGVPFFSMSASEFVEMIVGVGASRVRDLFAQAKKVAPAIIFIDELDAIGRARGGGASIGGHDEREQTLNQILTEMDGFTGSEGVIVLAATNRPEILDAALLRPGRFDRRVMVSPPDLAGRKAILEVHSRSVPLADDVDLGAIASSTPGMVGADLKNLVNEAALSAARRNYLSVTSADFSDALEKILLGTARGIMLSQDEKERTAFHESGHAVLGMLTPGADPVRKVTIIPRGRALGVTFQSPTTDRYGYSAEYLRGRITGAMGGRAAEEIVYGDVTTGAESDLEQATNIARQMVGRWGMSAAIGPVSVLPGPGQENPFGMSGLAPGTEERVDAEVRRILEECYADAVRLLTENRHHLDSLATRLIEVETLDEIDAYAAAGIPRDSRPIGDPLLSAGPGD
ncbi:MAG TPA: ATP-dependent zinc metalloprotease FtsH [Sporichthyaceae bacterium]|nr:ATP-dependent zinc metalloprotease FtsH [Sporichthyaceae bacterium]